MQSKFSFNSFSIVIPIFNEQEILEESVNNIFAICKRTQKKFEIILSENGSNDNTLEIAKKYQMNIQKLKSYHQTHRIMEWL